MLLASFSFLLEAGSGFFFFVFGTELGLDRRMGVGPSFCPNSTLQVDDCEMIFGNFPTCEMNL